MYYKALYSTLNIILVQNDYDAILKEFLQIDYLKNKM